MKMKNRSFFLITTPGNWSKALLILIIGLVLTAFAATYTQSNDEARSEREFALICNEIITKIDTRLHSHAQLLRSGSSFFATSDTVTREDWRTFIKHSELDKNLPGIQGVGYSQIIQKNQLQHHIQTIRHEGYPDYMVKPPGDRDIYTPVVYLEPFTSRNLRAFGYDMYSEPVRRKAMEHARDFDLATLSAKVILVQETDKDLQAGTLMYVPVYRQGLPTGTIAERRLAITGWVYSPYRMHDLMEGILGRWNKIDQSRIQLQVYDGDRISNGSLLFDSQRNDSIKRNDLPSLRLIVPVIFNDKRWTLLFSQSKEPFSFTQNNVIVTISGILISLLLFALSLSLFTTRYRAGQIAKQLTSELQQSNQRYRTLAEKKLSESDERLRLKNEELLQINAQKDKFFSIIAHDLRSPFNAFLGFTRMMVEDLPTLRLDQIQKIALTMRDSATNLFRLLNNLLDWSRMEQGLIPFDREVIRLLPLIDESMRMLKEVAFLKGIEMIRDIPDDLEIFADGNMMETVTRNLVSNAVKFTPRGGKVSISAKLIPGNTVELSVSDTGIGMDLEMMKELFRLNLKTSRKGTDNEPSSGLGLILCKDFIEKHGGKLWVESEEGKGSTFYFTIPCQPDPAPETT